MQKNEVPDLDRLFNRLQANRMPNFLELMSAIEDIGVYVRDTNSGSLLSTGDQNRADPPYLCPNDESRCSSCGL